MKTVNQILWLGMSSANNGAKSFAHITLDFTIMTLSITTVPLILSGTYKAFTLNVVVLNVIMLSVMAPKDHLDDSCGTADSVNMLYALQHKLL